MNGSYSIPWFYSDSWNIPRPTNPSIGPSSRGRTQFVSERWNSPRYRSPTPPGPAFITKCIFSSGSVKGNRSIHFDATCFWYRHHTLSTCSWDRRHTLFWRILPMPTKMHDSWSQIHVPSLLILRISHSHKNLKNTWRMWAKKTWRGFLIRWF